MRSINFEGLTDDPQIEVVLHPAVRHTQIRYGLEFLGNHRLPCIATQPRNRHVEQNRIVEPLSRGFGPIVETEIDIDGDAVARMRSPPYSFSSFLVTCTVSFAGLRQLLFPPVQQCIASDVVEGMQIDWKILWHPSSASRITSRADKRHFRTRHASVGLKW